MNSTELPPWAQNERTPAEIMRETDPGDDGYVVEESERWYIKSDSEAEWAMAHVTAATEQIEAIDTQYELWLDQLNAWRDRTVKDPARTAEFFTNHLAMYTIDVRERSKDKVKSIKLVSGDVSTSKSSRRIIISDEDAVITWAEDNGMDEIVKVTKKALVTPLREIAVIEDLGDGEARVVHHEMGTPIPGVDVTDEKVTATVKPATRPSRGALPIGVTGALPQ